MFSAYVWIDGETFDPLAFQKLLPEEVRGTVEARKRMVDGVVVRGGSYWKSDVVTADESLPESLLEGLLARYGEAITQARRCNATRVVLEVVNEYSEDQGAQGVFLHDGLVRLIAKVGAAVDIDVVRRLT